MFAGGAFFGFALLLSCDDDSPSDADAASCNCPPAEAPLLGRTQEFEVSTTLPPANMAPTFGKEGGSVDCPAGSGCRWKNLSNAPVPVRSIARCLMPAQ
jgi:hypothetical protein